MFFLKDGLSGTLDGDLGRMTKLCDEQHCCGTNDKPVGGTNQEKLDNLRKMTLSFCAGFF